MTSTRTRRRSRKASALLAATAALGLAGITTLATWTVTEYATAHFKSGFVPVGSMEASADGVNFGPHTTQATALSNLTWSSDTEAISSGDHPVAEYYLRAAVGTNTAVNVELTTEKVGTQNVAVSGYLLTDDSLRCAADLTTETLGAVSFDVSKSFTLPKASATAPGKALRFCLKVDQAGGEVDSTVIYKFTGTSAS